jgi:hypothetical protein
MPRESPREVPAQEESDIVLTQDIPTRVEMVTVDVPLVADSVREDGAEPRPGDATRSDASASGGGGCLDLVVGSPSPSLLGDTTPCDVVPDLGSLGAKDLGVTELWLPGYPNVPYPPISWR